MAPEAVWADSTDNRDMVVGEAEIAVLVEPARALLVALHAAHHGVEDEQALEDLARAVDRVPESTWRAAALWPIASTLSPPSRVGLRLLPEGSRLADTLELPDESTTELRLRASSAPEPLSASTGSCVRRRSARAPGSSGGGSCLPPGS